MKTMGWTWSNQPLALLAKYPTLATVPELVNRWPGLREAAVSLKLNVAPSPVKVDAPSANVAGAVAASEVAAKRPSTKPAKK
jgi:hypothetical protein